MVIIYPEQLPVRNQDSAINVTAMLFTLLYLQKRNVNPRNNCTLKVGRKCFPKNKSVLSSNNYGPGEKLGEVSSKNFTVIKLNRAHLEGWSNCAFRTPCNFVTAISHAWVMAAGCPDAEVLDNLNSCLRGDTAGSPWVPNEHPGHCYLLWGVLSGYDKSQTKYLFRHSRLQLCGLRQSLTFSHARFWVLKFSIKCYPLFLKTTYIIF